MRYSGTHKQETRDKVVHAAARQIRLKGPEAVSVADVMAEAGLTHGGFYAHFPSKDALIGEAVTYAFDQSPLRRDRSADALPPDAWLANLVDRYVSRIHRDRPETGCPIAALSSDLPRQGAAARAAFEKGIAGLIDSIASRLDVGEPGERQALAGSLVAEMAGAVSLARAVSDPDLSDDMLRQARRSVKARMGLPASPSPETRS